MYDFTQTGMGRYGKRALAKDACKRQNASRISNFEKEKTLEFLHATRSPLLTFRFGHARMKGVAEMAVPLKTAVFFGGVF